MLLQRTTRNDSLSGKYTNRTRIPFVLLVGLAVVACLAYAGFRSTLPNWWRQHGGGIPYVLFWIFLAHLIWPDRKHIISICGIVVAVTTGLEFLQLWNPEPLAMIRRTRLGVALLGNSFAWGDIPPYLVGGLIGAGVLTVVDRWRK